jgi:hypothetical protein
MVPTPGVGRALADPVPVPHGVGRVAQEVGRADPTRHRGQRSSPAARPHPGRRRRRVAPRAAPRNGTGRPRRGLPRARPPVGDRCRGPVLPDGARRAARPARGLLGARHRGGEARWLQGVSVLGLIAGASPPTSPTSSRTCGACATSASRSGPPSPRPSRSLTREPPEPQSTTWRLGISEFSETVGSGGPALTVTNGISSRSISPETRAGPRPPPSDRTRPPKYPTRATPLPA